MRKVHYQNCEEATSRSCRCAWCAGTRHGWQGAVKIAAETDPTRYEAFRSRAEEQVERERNKRKANNRKKATYPHKSAVIDLCRADLLGWLRTAFSATASPADSESHAPSMREVAHESIELGEYADSKKSIDQQYKNGTESTHKSEGEDPDAYESDGRSIDRSSSAPSGSSAENSEDIWANGTLQRERVDATPKLTSHIQTIGNCISEDVTNDIEQEYGESLSSESRRAMADHFWCDLLAQLANVFDKIIQVSDGITERVSELVTYSRMCEGRAHVDEALIQVATKHTLRRIQELISGGLLPQGKATLTALRILAIMLCKNPGRHQAVVEYCIDPLGGNLLRRTKILLFEVLPDWIPGINNELINSVS